MAPDFIERLKASAWHQLYLPLLPFTHVRSESIKPQTLYSVTLCQLSTQSDSIALDTHWYTCICLSGHMKFSLRPDYRPRHETAKTKTQTVNRQSTSR